MDINLGFHHATLSPSLLVLLAFASSGAVALVCRFTRKLGVIVALATSVFLVVLAGEHVPGLAMIAPRSFCFGDIGVLHVVCFALPAATAAFDAVGRRYAR